MTQQDSQQQSPPSGAVPPKRPKRSIRRRKKDDNISLEENVKTSVMMETTNLAEDEGQGSSSSSCGSVIGESLTKEEAPSDLQTFASSEISPTKKPVKNKRQKSKRNEKMDSSPSSSVTSSNSKPILVACRKSRRLMFKNTRKNRDDTKFNKPSYLSNPFGRVTEIVDQVKSNDPGEVLTKILFCANLDLIPKDIASSTSESASSSSSPVSPIVNKVGTLQSLCALSIAKHKIREYEIKEAEYLKLKENEDPDNPSVPWLNFTPDFLVKSQNIPLQDSKTQCDKDTALKECVEKLIERGTEVTFSDMASLPKSVQELLNQVTSSKCSLKEDDDEWTSWVEFMKNEAPFYNPKSSEEKPKKKGTKRRKMLAGPSLNAKPAVRA